MPQFNLLGHPEKLTRDISLRERKDERCSLKAQEFGYDYFDGSRETGYGGYYYDGRWVNVAKRLVSRYSLCSASSFLDVGCAKGFLMHDLSSICTGINVRGIDVSKYAKENAYKNIASKIEIGSCHSLPFDDNSFDASVAINTIHNLDQDGCKKAITELMRVTKNKKNIFIQVDAYNNDNEREMFETWVLTAQTYMKPSEWVSLFNDVGYQGDYFWTVIGFNTEKRLVKPSA